MRLELLRYHAGVEQIVQLSARNPRQATRIMLALRNFGNTGKGDLKKLSGSNDWRLRSGDWRMFLKLEGDIAWVFALSTARTPTSLPPRFARTPVHSLQAPGGTRD